MKKAAAVLLSFLAVHGMLLRTCEAVDRNCNYRQKLHPNIAYYVYNPEYPNAYRGHTSCQWVVESEYRIKLTCTEFQIPWTPNCSLDHFSVKVSETNTHRYCGQGSFTLESETNNLVITTESSFLSTGGKYLCLLEAIQKQEESDNCECGRKKPTRIVGGMETGINEYPMMAGLVDTQLRDVVCGATIIAKKYALTAAHCVYQKQPAILGLLVGDHNLQTGTETNATALLMVQQIIIHPGYEQTNNVHDIAIIKVVGEIKFSESVGPACLPFQHKRDSFGGSFVDLLGWGTTDFGGEKSDTLQRVEISVITLQQCSKTYPYVTDRNICTEGKGKDACQFDSGGPVAWQNPSTRRVVSVGIIAYGGVCGSGPAVNTRVGAYLDWIVSVTPDAAYCMIE